MSAFLSDGFLEHRARRFPDVVIRLMTGQRTRTTHYRLPLVDVAITSIVGRELAELVTN